MKNKHLKFLARDLRNHQTDPELIIWHHLRRKKVLNVTFNRQKPMYVYILDFYSDKAKLAIEIDGAQHFKPENLKNDQIRDEILLNSFGIKTLRFSNEQVLNNLNRVLKQIYFETMMKTSP